jgi:hypothetical protein
MSIFFAGNMVRQRHGIFNPPVSSRYTWVSSQGLAWYNNVLAAGASITNSNQAAFDIAFQAIYNAGIGNIAPAMQSSAFLMGFSDGSGGVGSAYKGCFVPIVGSPVNNGFVSSDFSLTAGLTGNGTSKYIDSGALNDSISSKHLFVYYSNAPTIGTYLIGSGITTSTNCWISTTNYNMSESISRAFTINSAPACAGVNRYTNALTKYYYGQGSNGSVGSAGGLSSVGVSSTPITIFSAGTTSFSNPSLVFYSVGTSFSSGSTELKTLSGIIETLRTSIT